MSAPIVVHSFEELASVLTEDDLSPESTERINQLPVNGTPSAEPDDEVAEVFARLEELMASLATTARQDEEA